MVSDSTNKMTSFSAAIRAFKNTESTAKGMIDTIYNVLDQDSQATVSVVKEIGQIFEEDGLRDKAKDILEAINGFRAQVSFPLPQPKGVKLTRPARTGIPLPRWSHVKQLRRYHIWSNPPCQEYYPHFWS
jgi:hypothetical protein